MDIIHPQITENFDLLNTFPDSKVHWANMGPIWGRQDPDGPHVGHMGFAIWDIYHENISIIHVMIYFFAW